jgi:hypothetical protein
MADRMYLFRDDGALRVVLVVHGHVNPTIIDHIVTQCVQILATLFDALHEIGTISFDFNDILLTIDVRFLEDLDTASTLSKLWTIARKTLNVLGAPALDLSGALFNELAPDGGYTDGCGKVGDGILNYIIEGDLPCTCLLDAP